MPSPIFMLRFRSTALIILFIFCIQIFSPYVAVAEGTPSPDPTIVHAAINEVMWMGSDKSTADEWIELAGFTDSLNTSTSNRRDLSHWTISTVKTNQESVIAELPAGMTIGTNEYLVISNYDVAASRLSTVPAFVSTSMSLPNTKLLLRLRDASGTLMDEVDDGVGDPFAGANPSGGGAKASMQRLDLRLAGNSATNWKTATVSRGFDDGAPILGTPGFSNEASSSSSSAAASSSSSSALHQVLPMFLYRLIPRCLHSLIVVHSRWWTNPLIPLHLLFSLLALLILLYLLHLLFNPSPL